MTKSPVLLSLGIAVVLSIVVFMVWQAATTNVDERPFVAAGVVVMFPFLWFLTWLVVNAIVWWRGMMAGNDEGGDA